MDQVTWRLFMQLWSYGVGLMLVGSCGVGLLLVGSCGAGFMWIVLHAMHI